MLERFHGALGLKMEWEGEGIGDQIRCATGEASIIVLDEEIVRSIQEGRLEVIGDAGAKLIL